MLHRVWPVITVFDFIPWQVGWEGVKTGVKMMLLPDFCLFHVAGICNYFDIVILCVLDSYL